MFIENEQWSIVNTHVYEFKEKTQHLKVNHNCQSDLLNNIFLMLPKEIKSICHLMIWLDCQPLDNSA